VETRRKHHAVPNENFVFHSYTLAKKTVRGNFASLPDDRPKESAEFGFDPVKCPKEPMRQIDSRILACAFQRRDFWPEIGIGQGGVFAGWGVPIAPAWQQYHQRS
jgi:hypothetical protein